MEKHNEPEDDPLVPLSTRIPKSVLRAYKYASLDTDRPIQDLVREALEEWLRRNRRKL